MRALLTGPLLIRTAILDNILNEVMGRLLIRTLIVENILNEGSVNVGIINEPTINEDSNTG